jgi:hypothetical protein
MALLMLIGAKQMKTIIIEAIQALHRFIKENFTFPA